MITTERPIFPPGVHDIIRTTEGRFVRVRCTAGDFDVEAHADSPHEVAMAVEGGWKHRRRKTTGQCHAACYDEHGHTDGCLYDGDDG